MSNLQDSFEAVKKAGLKHTATNWREAEPTISDGKLEILGHSVMEDWERPYMQELAHIASRNGGKILEVGFGLGISASYINEHAIDEYVVIEANKGVFQNITALAQTVPHKVTGLLGFWQDVVPTIPDNTFDGILFDTYPTSEEDLSTYLLAFFPHAYRLLKPGGVFTYFSHESETFSDGHYAALLESGFTNIKGTICQVDAPPTSYWKYPSILSPVVIK